MQRLKAGVNFTTRCLLDLAIVLSILFVSGYFLFLLNLAYQTLKGEDVGLAGLAYWVAPFYLFPAGVFIVILLALRKRLER